MKITKRMLDLKKGTMLYNDNLGFYWLLTSDYDECHGAYWAKDCELDLDDDGELVEGKEQLVTPVDLIGCEL